MFRVWIQKKKVFHRRLIQENLCSKHELSIRWNKLVKDGIHKSWSRLFLLLIACWLASLGSSKTVYLLYTLIFVFITFLILAWIFKMKNYHLYKLIWIVTIVQEVIYSVSAVKRHARWEGDSRNSSLTRDFVEYGLRRGIRGDWINDLSIILWRVIE